MTWFKVDDHLHSHPKAVDAGLAAMGLWVLVGSYCANYGTKGLVTPAVVKRIGGRDGIRTAQRLVASGLWTKIVDGDGWHFHDWKVFQPSADEIEAKREKRSSSGRLGAEKRWHPDSKQDGNVDGKPMALAMANQCQSEWQKDALGIPIPIPIPIPIQKDQKQIHSTAAPDAGSAAEPAGDGSIDEPAPAIPPESPSGVRKKQPERGTRFVDDWQPSASVMAWCDSEGIPRHEAVAEIPSFGDHWRGISGAAGVKLDWDATFRNRLRNMVRLGMIRKIEPRILTPKLPPIPPPVEKSPSTLAMFASEATRISDIGSMRSMLDKQAKTSADAGDT